MPQVRLLGWQHEACGRVDPIEFLKAVRDCTGMGLRDAKAVLDRFARDGDVVIDVPAGEPLERLSHELERIGSRCEPA